MKYRSFIYIILLTIGAVVTYKNSVHPVVLRTLFPTKIWPHRVNNISQLEEASNIFSGMELDVVWQNGNFDVNHPPIKSIGLNLEDYLKHLPRSRTYGLWVDYKNLEKNNAQESANLLDSLFKQEKLSKDRVYIESRNPKQLDAFFDRGFKISYYLPSGLSQIRHKDSIKEIVTTISSKLNYNPNLYISAPFSEYDFLNRYFPERKKLFWHLNDLYGPKNKWNIYKALLDSKTEVILFSYKPNLEIF